MNGDMNGLLRQAQKMQGDIEKVQEALGQKKVETSAGGGAVTAVVNGKQELLEIKIDPAVLDPEDVALLEDMIVGAVNQGMKRAEKMMNAEIEKVTGGFKIPGLF